MDIYTSALFRIGDDMLPQKIFHTRRAPPHPYPIPPITMVVVVVVVLLGSLPRTDTRITSVSVGFHKFNVTAPSNTISQEGNTLTLWKTAYDFGVIGLLAHNTQAGDEFTNFEIDDVVLVKHLSGAIERFVIMEILRYQALQPYSPYSSFRDEYGKVFSAEEVFRSLYMGERHVVFQTCIEHERNPVWGRLFIIAHPKGKESICNASYPFVEFLGKARRACLD